MDGHVELAREGKEGGGEEQGGWGRWLAAWGARPCCLCSLWLMCELEGKEKREKRKRRKGREKKRRKNGKIYQTRKFLGRKIKHNLLDWSKILFL
jgi:hypothetical protein